MSDTDHNTITFAPDADAFYDDLYRFAKKQYVVDLNGTTVKLVDVNPDNTGLAYRAWADDEWEGVGPVIDIAYENIQTVHVH